MALMDWGAMLPFLSEDPPRSCEMPQERWEAGLVLEAADRRLDVVPVGDNPELGRRFSRIRVFLAWLEEAVGWLVQGAIVCMVVRMSPRIWEQEGCRLRGFL